MFSFLQPVSGKTLGESIAPLITEFWLGAEGDAFAKMKATDLYDIAWTPHGTIIAWAFAADDVL